jgi:HKD family nuclease
MNNQEHILKNRLRDLIADRQVVAALFYSFNFDPKFFENYVMPLLVPEQTFINNSITNNILWRKLYKDNLVPPITVYFDQDAKSTDNGPYLDYQLVPVNMPMVGKNKGNFHPKHSFILVQNEDRSQELIIITGSNNLTQSGWCENIECIGEHTLINGKEFPYSFRRSIKEFIETVAAVSTKKRTVAEYWIVNYLKKIGYTKEKEFYFYNSYTSSFQEFLDNYVLLDDTINQLEIISPYFKKTPALLDTCIERNIKVKIQAPFKDEFCLLDETVFNKYKEAGIKWYYPDNDMRNNHSKVYRFYGSQKVYTIIGSVNLTEPAWTGFISKPKQIYNIESAILYVQKEDAPIRLFKKEIKDVKLRFIPPGTTAENWHERIEIPEIDFTINWLDKTLRWNCKAKNKCLLHLSASEIYQLNGGSKIDLSQLKHADAILDSIARKPILTVVEQINDSEQIHYYYANQIGFESRPLEFRLSASDIIDAWELLGSESVELNDWLVNRLELATDLLQDESGKLISDKTVNKSLLNEMARHFYGLVKLEEFLSNVEVLKRNRGTQSAQLNNIRYYLTCDNVDTLFSYTKDLGKLHESGSIMSVYYWLLLNIILINFYENKLLIKLLRQLYSENVNKNELKSSIANITNEIKLEIKKLEKTLDLDKKKIEWGLSILQKDYGIS